MIQAIVFASLACGAYAQTATGLATCLCIGNLPEADIPDFACSWDWAYKGMCVKPTGLASNFTDYPANFGEYCGVYADPGHSSCYDLTTVPPTAKEVKDQADWCLRAWCYVDPCNCDASDATKSDYFPGTLFYSYATCGEKNTYTAMESATNQVGNAACQTAGTDDSGGSSSGAYTLKMGLGVMPMIVLGMGALN
jgi:hypothetical protein